MSCPVDHTNMPPKSSGGCPVDHGQSSSADKCPVDHTPNSTSTSTWARLFGNSSTPGAGPSLSTEREVSSIPRGSEEGNWVYPSEAQFFAAMARKNHDPHATDMKTIVPIHNAVNERAWAEIQKWEAGRGGEACGGCRLVSFQGKPTQRTPKATFMTLLGYSAPFDRHDWIVDRCGVRTRYVIDFYTGRSQANNAPSFYLDVRPALDNWEGVKMRAERLFGDLLGPGATANAPSTKSTTP